MSGCSLNHSAAGQQGAFETLSKSPAGTRLLRLFSTERFIVMGRNFPQRLDLQFYPHMMKRRRGRSPHRKRRLAGVRLCCRHRAHPSARFKPIEIPFFSFPLWTRLAAAWCKNGAEAWATAAGKCIYSSLSPAASLTIAVTSAVMCPHLLLKAGADSSALPPLFQERHILPHLPLHRISRRRRAGGCWPGQL